MKRSLKILSLLLALAMLLTIAAACGKDGGKKQSDKAGLSGDSGNGEATDYTVSLKTAGGMALSGIDVYIYADASKSDMKTFGKTDDKGLATFNLPQSSQYAVVLSGVPAGYDVKDSYAFDGTTAVITLTSALITNEELSSVTLKLGDVMRDFTVTTPDGEKVTLSEMLKEKKMVLINFWYTTCSWCVTEFPYMEQAYQLYKDDVGIVAVDPMPNDTDAAIKAFPANYSLDLSFPLAACPTAWSQTFNIQGYPTSVIVDRYGVITLIESGAITSLNPFTSLFETMTADDYQQKLYNSIGEMIVNPKPTYEMDTPENVAAILNSGDIQATYHAETQEGSKEYAWPFIATEKLGKPCLKASNQGIDDSFGVLYADVTLKKGQALGIDYLISSEASSDIMVIIVDGEDIFTISGFNDPEKWQSCYPIVADKDGTYEVAIFYLKDESTAVADDTVYIRSLRVVDPSKIDTPTYLPKYAAKPNADGTAFEYVDLFFNSADGYYHVGSKNGPLLLADLMGYTEFSETSTVWEMASEGKIVVGGKNYLEELTQYCNYASNAKGGLCTVNQELMELLQKVDQAVGFDDADNNEWLKLCKYYAAYGSNGQQLEDPIKGLATFSALTAKEGKNVKTNFFYYEQILMPRGKLAKFVPTKSGVYRITSRSESAQGVDGWLFDKDHKELLVYEHDERLYEGDEVSMVYYMKKGEAYYIDIAFWDVYEVGYIYYDIEYMGAEVDHFRLCSPGYFTYDSDETGNDMYHLIAGGIDVVLGSDGIYYEDLGNGKKGSKIYADFYGITPIFDKPLQTMIKMNAFDFSKTEDDLFIVNALALNGNDKEKTKAYLKEQWAENYETNYEDYKVDEVFAGKYHGTGKDYTAKIKEYEKKIIKSGAKELQGCVVVTEELAEILQQLMGKYTFEDVDNSWLKVCYYYDHLGPNG